MSLTFVNELPEPTRGSRMHLKLAEELRRRPGEWAIWPRKFPSSSIASTTKRNIRGGKLKHFPAGQFETKVVDAVLYIRFVGGDE